MKELIEYFSTSGNIVSFSLALVIIVIIVKTVEKLWSWVSEKLLKYYNFKRGKETEKETLQKYGERIQEVNQKLEQHIKDADEKLEKRMKEVDDKLDVIGDKVDGMVTSLGQFEVRQKNVNTIVLRDKIKYIYKKCLTDGYILDKDKRDFKDAYDEYIENGGNSYVKDEVEPFVHNLRVFLSEENAALAGYGKAGEKNNVSN